MSLKNETPATNITNAKHVHKNKTILVDADGVLLDWEHGFKGYMLEQFGLVSQEVPVQNAYCLENMYNISSKDALTFMENFNTSARIGFLTPYGDVKIYVEKLVQLGYDFKVITALGTDESAQKLRIQNLQRVFGVDTFSEFVFLPCSETKREVLTPFAGSECWWVEDNVTNAEIGVDLGLNSVIIPQRYNAYYNGSIPKMRWKEIYEKIKGDV